MNDYAFKVDLSVDPVLTAQEAGLPTLEAVRAFVEGVVSMALEQVTDHGVHLNGPIKVTDLSQPFGPDHPSQRMPPPEVRPVSPTAAIYYSDDAE